MIARVFPRRTNATPDDGLAFTRDPMLSDFALGIERVLVSVAFSYDIEKAEKLAESWAGVAPVEIGGPAFGKASGDFIPGVFLKLGYTITSRGCPNHCWFCSVSNREGDIRELPIRDGWNVLDDNILACSEKHIRAVFAMLKRQPERARFTGGLEAKLLRPWHVDLLAGLKPKVMFFSYDTPDDFDPLALSAKMLRDAGFTPASHSMCCYVLIGWPKDTMQDAEDRIQSVMRLGMMPQAMLWRNQKGERSADWMHFQKLWANKFIVGAKMKGAVA
jgi:hypothetical protein